MLHFLINKNEFFYVNTGSGGNGNYTLSINGTTDADMTLQKDGVVVASAGGGITTTSAYGVGGMRNAIETVWWNRT